MDNNVPDQTVWMFRLLCAVVLHLQLIAGLLMSWLIIGLIYYSQIVSLLNPLYTGNPLKSTLENSEDSDEMQHNAAFHQGLHCLLRSKQILGTEIHQTLINLTVHPLKYTMGSLILIVSIFMRKSIRIQRFKEERRGSVGECLTRDPGVAGLSLAVGTVLCP